MKKSTLKNLALALAASLLIGELAPLCGAISNVPKIVSAADNSPVGRAAPANFRKYGITYKDYVEKNGEPTSAMLLVGTYLISIVPTITTNSDGSTLAESVSGESYQSAIISKLTYQQDVYFYKSELNGGNWVDLDTASSLNYLKPNTSILVDKNELNSMLITAVVNGDDVETIKNDGKSDENPFLYPSPYNLDDISSLSPIMNALNDGKMDYTADLKEQMTLMYANDEATDTIPLQSTDVENSKDVWSAIAGDPESLKGQAKEVSDFINEVQRTGVIDERKLNQIADESGSTSKATPTIGSPLVVNAAPKNPFTGGLEGSIASAARLQFHFSDARDDYTDKMDKAVINMWDWYVKYKYGNVSFVMDSEISNAKKAALVYDICSMSDAERRARALYNLTISTDFHGGQVRSLRQIATDKSFLGELNYRNAGFAANHVVWAWMMDPNSEYNKLPRYDDNAHNKLSRQKTAEVTAAIWDTYQAIKQAYEETNALYVDYSARTFVRGNTIVSRLVYDDEMKIIEMTDLNDEANKIIEEIFAAEAVRDDKVIAPVAEAAVIQDKIIDEQGKVFRDQLAVNVPTMTAAKQNGYSGSNKWQEYFSVMENKLKTLEKEQERLVNLYLKCEKQEDAYTAFLKSQYRWAKELPAAVPQWDNKYGTKPYYYEYWSRANYNNWIPRANRVIQTYLDYLIAKMKELGIDTSDLDIDGFDDEDDPILKALKDALEKALKDGDQKLADALQKLIDKYNNKPTDTPPGFTPVVDIDPTTGLPYVKFVPDDPYTPTDTGNGGDPGDTGDNNNTTANDPNNPNGNVNNRDPNDPNYGDPEDPNNPNFDGDPNDTTANDPNNPNGNVNNRDPNDPNYGDPEDPNNPNFDGDPNDTTANDPNGNDTDPNGRNPNGSNNGENDRAGNGDYNGDDGTGTGNGANGNGSGSGTGRGNGNGSNGDGAGGRDTYVTIGNGSDDGDGSGSGNGSGTGRSLPVPNGDMLANLEAMLGMSFDDMGLLGKAALVAALNEYGRDYGSDEAAELSRDLLADIMAENNPFVYTKYKNVVGLEYVSLGAIDRARLYTRYRLVREGLDMTMARLDAGYSYVYRYGESTVKRIDGKTEDLMANLVSQKDPYMNRGQNQRFPYLYEDDAQSKLGCRAEYIEETNYAVLVTSAMEPEIDEYVEMLIDLYGSNGR